MHTSVPYSEITNFGEFKDSFVEPTLKEFLRFKFVESFPTYREAYYDSMCFGDPMTESEYQSYVEHIGQKEADEMLKLKALTPFGWYLTNWYRYIKNMFFYDFASYRDQIFDNECNEWFDFREDMRRKDYY